MRQYARTAFLLLAIFLFGSVHALAGWVDGWVDQYAETPAGNFQGQQRGYYTAGGVSARWRMSTDHPIAVTTPKLSAGCGGIDAFGGGIALMDTEYLTEKLQRVLEAAPAVALDMAMKTMCKECSETMKSIEQMANLLNGLQLDDCAMSKKLVATVSSDDPDIIGAMWNEISSGVSLGGSTHDSHIEHNEQVAAGGGDAPVDLDEAIEGCPPDFKQIYGGGSVVANAAEKVGLKDYADTIRGFVGDVEVDFAGNTPQVTRVKGCRENQKVLADNFLDGTAKARSAGIDGTCYDDSATRLAEYVETQMQGVASKLGQKNAQFTADESGFIDNAPLPVFKVLQDAVMRGTSDFTIGVMAAPIATAYAVRVLDDLYRQTEYLLEHANEAGNPVGVTPDVGSNVCDPKVLVQATEQAKVLRGELLEVRRAARQAFATTLAEQERYLAVVEHYAAAGKETRRRFYRDVGRDR